MSETSVVNGIVNAVLERLIPIAVVVIGGYVAHQLAPAVRAWVQAHIDATTLANINTVLMDVVASAEGARIKAELAGKAFEVLEWAFDEADVRLNELGIDIDADRLFNLLRGALLTYLASQGVSLEVPAEETQTISLNVDGTTSRMATLNSASSTAPAKQALAARLWA